MRKAEAIESIGLETKKVVREVKRKENRASKNAKIVGFVGLLVTKNNFLADF